MCEQCMHTCMCHSHVHATMNERNKQTIGPNGLSKLPAGEQRTDTHLGRSPRWRRDPVLFHTSKNPGLLHQW